MESNNIFMSSGLNIDLGDQVVSLPKVIINGIVGTFESFSSENNVLKVRIGDSNPWKLFQEEIVKATIFGSEFEYTIEWNTCEYSIESNEKGYTVTVGDK